MLSRFYSKNLILSLLVVGLNLSITACSSSKSQMLSPQKSSPTPSPLVHLSRGEENLSQRRIGGNQVPPLQEVLGANVDSDGSASMPESGDDDSVIIHSTPPESERSRASSVSLSDESEDVGSPAIAGALTGDGGILEDVPLVTILPRQGSALGGQKVTFTGREMDLVSAVKMTGTDQDFCHHLRAVRVGDDTQLTCFVAPSGSLGVFDLTLEKRDGHPAVELARAFTFVEDSLTVYSMSLWEKLPNQHAQFKIYGRGFHTDAVQVTVNTDPCTRLEVLEQGTLLVCELTGAILLQDQNHPFDLGVRVSQREEADAPKVRELSRTGVRLADLFEGLNSEQQALKDLARRYRIYELSHQREQVGDQLRTLLFQKFRAEREELIARIIEYSESQNSDAGIFADYVDSHSLQAFYRAFLFSTLKINEGNSDVNPLLRESSPGSEFLSVIEVKRNFFHGKSDMPTVQIGDGQGQPVGGQTERLHDRSHLGYTVETLVHWTREVLTDHPDYRLVVRQLGGEEIQPRSSPPRAEAEVAWSLRGLLTLLENRFTEFLAPEEEPMPLDASILALLVEYEFIEQ